MSSSRILGFILYLYIFLVNLGVCFSLLPRIGRVSVVQFYLHFFIIDCSVEHGMSKRLEMVPLDLESGIHFDKPAVICR